MEFDGDGPKMDSTQDPLSEFTKEKILLGEELVLSLDKYSHLEGIGRIRKKVLQELNFLKKSSEAGIIKKEHLQCSHLTHFSAVLKALSNVKNCTSVSKTILLDERKITIDIVCDDGLRWIKVIAKNPKALSQISAGDTSYGVRSVIDQAQDFTKAATLYPYLFQIPEVVFIFANGVRSNLAAKLESYNIVVEGLRLSDNDLEEYTPKPEESLKDLDVSTANILHIKKVNLDISAMIAYICSVSNGSVDSFAFPPTSYLAQQIKSEKERPLKPILEDFMQGKNIYCCHTARDSFSNIVNLTGGPNEKKRAQELLERITVLPDDATITENIFQMKAEKPLSIGGKIKEKTLKVFKFGDRIGAVTMTSNDAFVRSAKQQGVDFVVFIHESRALSELKEISTDKIARSNC